MRENKRKKISNKPICPTCGAVITVRCEAWHNRLGRCLRHSNHTGPHYFAAKSIQADPTFWEALQDPWSVVYFPKLEGDPDARHAGELEGDPDPCRRILGEAPGRPSSRRPGWQATIGMTAMSIPPIRIDWFAEQMKKKLALQGGFKKTSNPYLVRRLIEKTAELGDGVWYALPLGDEPVLKIKSNADLTVALHRLENDFAEMCEHFREIEKIVSIIDKK